MRPQQQEPAANDSSQRNVGATFAGRVIRDAFRPRGKPRSRDEHLDAAIAWLKRAQAATRDGGVSYGYSIRGGWRPSYREASGYIAVTFFDLARQLHDEEAGTLGRTVSDWLCEVQEPDGSIANPRYHHNEGIVFDTGQVLLGYVRAYRETGEARFVDAATLSASWLASSLDEDGAWRRNTHLQTPHTYNVRAAWAMLESNDIAPDPIIEAAARRNLDWGLEQQTPAGYFRSCAFEPGFAPFTHTIAYAIRGFLESGRLLEEPVYTDTAIRAADAALQQVRGDGWIPGQIDEAGQARAGYCCLTGNCQLATIWLKLHRLTGSQRYLEAAKQSLDYVMSCQDVVTPNLALRGAIKGSHPIWGRYAPLSYPSWATKFFIDAILLSMDIES